MNDHDLFPPPPVEPLDDATRARLRARVLDGLDDGGSVGSSRRPRRWVVPAGAAAAVVVVVGVAAGVALKGDPQGSGAPVDPAGSGSPTASPSVSSDASDAPTPESGDPTPPVDDAACQRELRFVLRGAEPVASTSSETGTTTFLVLRDRWTLCSTHGGRTTVHRPRRLGAPDDQESYGVSSVYSGPDTSTYVAGGVLPDGVTDAAITYGFPDGHTEPADLVRGDDGRTWWSMDYTVTGGELNTGNTLRLDPIRVDVVAGGVEETYELEWAINTCQQANHGC